MRILFNTDQVCHHGGIEKVLAIKANFFSLKLNFKVSILTTENRFKPFCYKMSEEIDHHDIGINYDRSKSYFSWFNFKRLFTHFFKQRAYIKSIKPDVIISPNYNFDHYWLPFIKGNAILIKERHNSRYTEFADRKSNSFLKKLKYSFNDWIDSKYDHIVVLNEDEKIYVKSNNAVVIPNPIDPSSIVADMSTKKVIAAGRISRVKGFDHLVKAWNLLKDEFPDWELHIYGPNYLSEQDYIQAEINRYGLQEKIFFKGVVDDVRSYMKDYSIYAMSSISECFPMVLLESLTVGLPIVSYDCPNGPRHIVKNNEDGLLVENQNFEDFAEKLSYLMKSYVIRQNMGDLGRINVSRFYSKTIMKDWLKLIQKDLS